MMNRREYVRLAAFAAVAGGLPPVLAGAAPMQDRSPRIGGRQSLKEHAKRRGLFYGCAVDVKILRADGAYRELLAQQCDILVGESCMKWSRLRPTPESYAFSETDDLMAFARQHGMKVRGHNFVWHLALPDWFAATVTKENAERFLTEHISTVGGRYKGKIQSWDVVNEAIWTKDGRPDGLRDSPWLRLLGPQYLEIAFRAARKADPQALLTYNEYGIELDNEENAAKRAATLALLRRLKSANVPIDAVGIQSHLHAADKSAVGGGLVDFMASVRGMGMQIYLTEMDVDDSRVNSEDVAERDREVAAVYRSYLATTLAEPAVKSVLTWGISDSHTWLNNGKEHDKAHPGRMQRDLPFDEEYKPTEVFFAMREAFDQARRR